MPFSGLDGLLGAVVRPQDARLAGEQADLIGVVAQLAEGVAGAGGGCRRASPGAGCGGCRRRHPRRRIARAASPEDARLEPDHPGQGLLYRPVGIAQDTDDLCRLSGLGRMTARQRQMTCWQDCSTPTSCGSGCWQAEYSALIRKPVKNRRTAVIAAACGELSVEHHDVEIDVAGELRSRAVVHGVPGMGDWGDSPGERTATVSQADRQPGA